MKKGNRLLLIGEIQANSEFHQKEQIISIDKLERILTKFFGEKINLKIE